MAKVSINDVRAILTANGVDQSKVAILALRGYKDPKGSNQREVYDDVMFVVSPEGVEEFQANTDPNGFRKGSGTGANKGMAMLKNGIHIFGRGPHKGKDAYRQCEVFTVTRDGDPPYDDVGWHAIDLHSGGYNSTSSLGCQTIPAGNWQRFKSTLNALLEKYDNPKAKNDLGQLVRSFPYVLLDEKRRLAGDVVVSKRYLK